MFILIFDLELGPFAPEVRDQAFCLFADTALGHAVEGLGCCALYLEFRALLHLWNQVDEATLRMR